MVYMKRAFRYSDEKSSKFWWIDYSGNDLVVNYGKIGTNGKYEIKEFDSPEECEKQGLKLIEQKVKKGYTPYLEFDFIKHNYFDDKEINLHPKTSHPHFVEHFTADFYYDCGKDEAPFGSDNGHDTLSDLQEHIKKNGNVDITISPKMLIEKSWGMSYFPPDNIDEKYLLKIVQGDKFAELENDSQVYMNDQVIIATAFGQIKITGMIQQRLRVLAIQSLKRMAILRKHQGYPTSDILEQMRTDLERFKNHNEIITITEECNIIMKYLDCPCEVFANLLDDDDMIFAYECALREGKEKGYTPLMVVVDETLLEQITMEVDEDSDMDFEPAKVKDYRKSIIKKAMGIDAKQFLQERKEEYIQDVEMGKIRGGENLDLFTSFWNYDTRLTKEVILAKIPTDKPWELAAWLPMGGFNDCPSPAEQVAVLKYWYEKYAAIPAVVSYETWEFGIKQPIASKEEALALALEHLGFCYDRIMQYGGYDYTVGKLASTLMNSKTWYFWWD